MAIQRKPSKIPTKQFLTKRSGWGLKTDVKIESGSFVAEYVGEVISEKKYKERIENAYKGEKNSYATYLDSGYVIDAHTMGNSARFINHSCSPNCEAQKWFVNGYPHIAIYALKNIAQHEELTFDYNFEPYGDPTICQCGSVQCRGFITRKVTLFIRVLVYFKKITSIK